ncbi:SH3 domain-containing protein [Streptomyces sp. NEAU-H22]|uniref:SH3 domain-containing protein n=1 Tax=Streptomyces sp. NEAU-H22 TaxID=2994655 RepID=UPI0022518FD2|nr:SH3 domain-containing protein [Streptomyces sp. NEAU-H22]MCX3287060.1 SH3 domain-containing protein [Streptomyces sp. NEAU-H22]
MTQQRAKLRTRVPARLAASAMLALSLTAAEMPCKPKVYYYVYKSSGVNFRTGAGTGYASKGLLHKNDWGKKVATKGSWIKLRLGQKSKSGLAKGTTGWVSKSYVSDCTPMQLD